MDAEIKQYINTSLKELSHNIPIKWDRFTENQITNLVFWHVYGWLPSKKHEADFIVLIAHLDVKSAIISAQFVTSSTEYSKQLAKNWGCKHGECKKWEFD